MPAPRIARPSYQHVPKQREGMSKSHLDNIRDLPCCVTGSIVGIEAHHLLRTGEHGIGRKSSDRWAIPLSKEAHDALHRAGDEEAYLARHGVDGRALASALWAARGDIEAMARIVFRCLQEARLKVAKAS